MTQNSYPKGAASNASLSDHEWKHIFLGAGRGIVDLGGHPYRLTARDSVTDTVTISVDTRHGENWALLDGFVHHMDADETLSVPPVGVDTTYEIGLLYDPLQHNAPLGPITLTVLTTPVNLDGGKSWLVLYRLTRKPNLALGSTPYTEERPRVAPVFTVSTEASLPLNSLVLVDSIGVVRTTGQLHRAEIATDGTITWPKIGAADLLESSSTEPVAGKLVRYGGDGGFLVIAPTHASHPATKGYVDGKNYSWTSITGKPSTFTPSGHTHNGSDINSRVPFEHVDGSLEAYSNTNLGSTWTSVAVNSAGFLGRYPSALKYKQNIRSWAPDPQTILDIEPVQYDVRPDTAGASESSDKGLIGFVADSYVQTRRELVLLQDGEVEGFHYHLMPVAQQVVLRWQEKRIKALEATVADLTDRLTALEQNGA